jgi:hypothetical protein
MLTPIAPVEAIISEEPIVINYKLYSYPELNGVLVMGEIINNLETAVSRVNVSITFYDAGAHELKKAYCTAFLGVIPPSRRSAFKYPFKKEEIENFKYCDVKVSSYTVSESSKPTGFSIVSATATLYPNRTEVTGTIRNMLSTSLRFLNIFALLYDENGFVAATDSDITLVELKPDSTESFDCVTRVINDTFDIVKCIITGESQSYGVEKEKIIYSAKNQNEGFNYMIVAAVIIGIAALALSLILLRKRHKKRKQSIRRKLSRGHRLQGSAST